MSPPGDQNGGGCDPIPGLLGAIRPIPAGFGRSCKHAGGRGNRSVHCHRGILPSRRRPRLSRSQTLPSAFDRGRAEDDQGPALRRQPARGRPAGPAPEFREIGEEVRLGTFRDAVELVLVPGARPVDLLRKLNECRPQVVHFSSHGSPDEILLEAEEGQDEASDRSARPRGRPRTGHEDRRPR